MPAFTLTKNQQRLSRALHAAICFMIMLASCAGRDLSTPSSRLIGHWINEHEVHHYFGAIDLKTDTGIFVSYNNGEATYFNYQVINEDLRGEKIIIEIFGDEYPQYPEFTLTKDGAIKAGYGGVFAYVDGKKTP
jgi:hypothetical protein